MSIIRFYEINTDLVKNAHFLVRDLEDRSKNCRYVAAKLSDGESTVVVNMFNPDKTDSQGLTVSMLEAMGIKNDCIIETDIKKNERFYNVSDWKLNTDPSVTKKDFARSAPIDADEAYNWIVAKVKEADANPDCVGPYKSLSHLTLNLLEKNREAFKNGSAAVFMHHNFIGGLIFHTYRMLSLAIKTCETYGTLDKELLVCGTVLHDIGKVSSLATDEVGDSSMTVEGRLLEHAMIGYMMIHDEAQKNLYNPEKILMLEHMIASHHGKLEYGAATTPAFPEAQMLHLIDMMDSRMNMFEIAYKEQEPGTVSEKKVWGLEESHIYKPSYYDEDVAE